MSLPDAHLWTKLPHAPSLEALVMHNSPFQTNKGQRRSQYFMRPMLLTKAVSNGTMCRQQVVGQVGEQQGEAVVGGRCSQAGRLSAAPPCQSHKHPLPKCCPLIAPSYQAVELGGRAIC